MIKGAAVDFFVFVGCILLGTFIGAIFLKAACALLNRLAGVSLEPPARTVRRAVVSPSSTEITTAPVQKQLSVVEEELPNSESITTSLPGVPRPSFEWAMAIVFVAALANALMGFILLRLLRVAGRPSNLDVLVFPPINFFYHALSLLILSGTIKVMLPTSFGKGVVLAVLFMLFSAALSACIIGGIVLSYGPGALRFG